MRDLLQNPTRLCFLDGSGRCLLSQLCSIPRDSLECRVVGQPGMNDIIHSNQHAAAGFLVHMLVLGMQKMIVQHCLKF
jgi:hypothetical protein